jgi:hypothetical protein
MPSLDVLEGQCRQKQPDPDNQGGYDGAYVSKRQSIGKLEEQVATKAKQATCFCK